MTLHFNKAGKQDGRPLIFIHGFGINSAVWGEQVKLFSKNRLVITIDLPGHGSSKPLNEAEGKLLTIPLSAHLIAALIKSEGWLSADVIGWSLGAEVAMLVAKEMGGDVRSIGVVGGTPCYIAQADGDVYGMNRTKAKFFSRQLERDFRPTLGVFIHSFFHQEQLSKQRMREISNLFFDSNFPPHQPSAMQLLASLYEEDLRQQLSGLPHPTMIIHGEHDMIVPLAALPLWREMLPRSSSKVFENCGHAPFLLYPERFYELMNDFYKGLA